MQIKTGCPLDCWDTCSIKAEVNESGVVTRLIGDADHPITQGSLCAKGLRLRERLYHPERVLYPLKKVNGTFERISWNQAYEEIAAHAQQVLNTVGHQGILHAYDWGSGAVSKNLIQRFFNLLGGCSETVGSLCWDAGLEAQRYDFGQARAHHPSDAANANGIVVWGRNVSVTNIHMMPFIKQATAHGATLVVINPLPTDLDGRANLVIHPRPGSDGALAFGVLKICRDRGWLDETFLAEHSVGWDILSDYIDLFTLEEVARETDVSPADILRLAEVYGQVKPVTTLLGIGLQRHLGGGNTIRAIDALSAATGHVGVMGGGVNYANRMMGDFLEQETMSGTQYGTPRQFSRGGQAEDILTANPPIQMMFVTRTNAVTQVPNTASLLHAYETIPVKVVVDQFMTQTAELADYVLPCTNALEDEDFVFSTMWHPYVTYMNPVVKPLGESKSDWQIFAELADVMGVVNPDPKTLHEWFSTVLAPLASYGITLETLREQGTIRIPTPDIPWQDYQFATPSAKFEFVSSLALADGFTPHAIYVPSRNPYERDELAPDHQYPYRLLTTHPRVSENSQHKSFPHLPDIPVVAISEGLAQSLGLNTGDHARLWNDRAALTVEVRTQAGMHSETLQMESGWWGQGVTTNHFTSSQMADFGDQTAQYDCFVNLRPIRAKEGTLERSAGDGFPEPYLGEGLSSREYK